MRYVKAEETEYPICPFCEKQLDTIKYKDVEGGFFATRKLIFFCPSYYKVLGNADASDSP